MPTPPAIIAISGWLSMPWQNWPKGPAHSMGVPGSISGMLLVNSPELLIVMDTKQMKAKLTAENGLEALWVDVWRRQFWAFVGNPSASREALALTLHTLQSQAEAAWGQENFWIKAAEALNQATGETEPDSAPEKAGKASKDAALKINDADRLLIAQAVAAASMKLA